MSRQDVRLDLIADSDADAVAGSDMEWPGGKGLFVGEAEDWDSATLVLQLKTTQGTYINVPSASLTANGMFEVNLPAGLVRASTSGGQESVDGIYAYLIGIRE